MSVAIARIHELEAILTKFVKTDISSQFHEIKEELEKKKNLCGIIEKQNQELTDQIVQLEQSLLIERQKKSIIQNNDKEYDDKIENGKRMRHSMNELSMETQRLSQLLSCSQYEKTQLKQSMIELNVKHKTNENTISQLKHNLDKNITKHQKLQFQNRSLRLKLRDALSFKELYFKLKNKNIADKKHYENSLNELKTTHWNTLKELSQFKEKDLMIQPLKIKIKKYQEKYEKLEDNFVSQQNRNKMLQTKFDKIEKDYFKSKKQVDDLQNDNHKLMIANKKLLTDCMKKESISRCDNIKQRSFIGSPRKSYLEKKIKKNSVSTGNEMIISTNDVLNESNLIEIDDNQSIRCNSVYHWNIQHVGQWLKDNLPKILTHQAKIPQYIDSFRTHGIDGNKLLLMDNIALDLIGIKGSENQKRVLNVIDHLRQNSVEYNQENHDLLLTHDESLQNEISNTHNITMDDNDSPKSNDASSNYLSSNHLKKESESNHINTQLQPTQDELSPTQSMTMSLSFTDTESINQYCPSSNNNTSLNNNETIRIELKTVKRKKNQLIVSIKMLTKQLKKCKQNNEMGKYNTIKIEIDKKIESLKQVKENIANLKQILGQSQGLQQTKPKSLKSEQIEQDQLHNTIPTRIPHFMFDQHQSKFQAQRQIKNISTSPNIKSINNKTDGSNHSPYRMFPDDLSSTVSQKPNNYHEKTFTDVISDTQSIIHNLNVSNMDSNMDSNTHKSHYTNPFPFSPKTTSKTAESTTISDKFDPTFTPDIVNPFAPYKQQKYEQSKNEAKNALIDKIVTKQHERF